MTETQRVVTIEVIVTDSVVKVACPECGSIRYGESVGEVVMSLGGHMNMARGHNGAKTKHLQELTAASEILASKQK